MNITNWDNRGEREDETGREVAPDQLLNRVNDAPQTVVSNGRLCVFILSAYFYAYLLQDYS